MLVRNSAADLSLEENGIETGGCFFRIPEIRGRNSEGFKRGGQAEAVEEPWPLDPFFASQTAPPLHEKAYGT